MIDKDNQKLRDDMMFLLGQIDALQFPLMWEQGQEARSGAYYDWLDSIRAQYLRILKQTIGYEE